MKTCLNFFLPFLFFSCTKEESISVLSDYNVVWTSQSENSSESIPLVGGDIGCNVWVENGDVMLYIQRSGSLSEKGEYLKMGRFRLQLTPNPFNQFQLGDEEIQLFKNAYEKAPAFRKGKVHSWHQDSIQFARMGMTIEAVKYNTKKLQDSPRRFPTFWGPGHDWVPDHNWGGSGMIGLQEMLMQTIGEKLFSFPPGQKNGMWISNCTHRKTLQLKFLLRMERLFHLL